MDFSWSAFFVGVIIAFPIGFLVGTMLEQGRDKPEERVREAQVASEIKHLRWMVAELEVGRLPPAEYLENNRSAIESARQAEETMRRWGKA